MNGDKIKDNINETKKIILAGHEIGNHSFAHKRLLFKSFKHLKNEIARTDSLINLAGFSKTIHFRPPYGKKFIMLPYYLNKNNRKTIMWDIEPETYASNAKNISEFVLNNTTNGSIILLHVMYKSGEESLKSVPEIIKGLKEKDFKFMTVSELLKHHKP